MSALRRVTPGLRAAVFAGAFAMSAAIGLALAIWGHASIVLEVAILLALSQAVTLCAAEWLSPSPNGLGASAMLGGSAGAGMLAPALPYQFASGLTAEWLSISVAVILTGAMTYLEARDPAKTWHRTAAQTYGVTTGVFLLVLAAAWIVKGRL
jgi:hypothetical protein